MSAGLNLDACAIYVYGLNAKEMKEAGFSIELLDGKYHNTLRFLDTHLEQGKIPALDDIEKLFGVGYVEQTNVSPKWLVGELRKRLLHHHLAVGVDLIHAHLANNNPEIAFEAAKALVEASPTLSESSSHSVFDEIDNVKTQTEQAMNGFDGLDTPWPSYNKLTRGFLPSKSSWFCARSGVGKTWILLIICSYLWSQRFKQEGTKVKILFISPELKKSEVAERFFTFVTQTSYVKVVGGTFDTFGKNKFFKAMDEYQGQDGFYVMDEDDNPTPERIEAEIRRVQPDIVAIDAAYEIVWNKDRDQMARFNAGSSMIRKWTRRSWPTTEAHPLWGNPKKPGTKSIAMLVSSQVNRSGVKGGTDFKGKKREEAPLESQIALSDQLMWAADNMFILEQDKDLAADLRLKMLRVKVRRGADYKIKEILCDWNFDTMNFNEVGVAAKPFEDNVPIF